MKYYRLKTPLDKKAIGIADGGRQAQIVESKWKNKKELKRFIDDYILEIWQTLERLEKGEEVKPPVLEYIKLRNQALVTDFIGFSESYAGGEYLISSKVNNILSQFNCHCRIYESVSLYHLNNPVKGYFNLHVLPMKFEQVIDFERSIFYTGTWRAGNKTLYYPPTYKDYVGLGKYAGRLVSPEQLCLKLDVIEDADLFFFDHFPFYCISERLKQAFEKEKVTGVVFLDPEEPRLVFS